MKKTTMILAFSFTMAILVTACGPKKTSTDMTSTHTTAPKETMAAATTEASSTKTPAAATTASQESTAPENDAKTGTDAARVTTSIHTYTSGKLSIEYPVISGLSSASVQDSINQKLTDRATSVIEAYGMDGAKDQLTVTCRVVTADRRRITAVYTGLYTPENAAYPTNLFFTTTLDTSHGTDLGLNDYADAYTLAGYVLSDDCRFTETDPELLKALKEEKGKKTLDEYNNLFRRSDFPYKENKSSSSSEIKFPESFSYEEKGTIYVSIPVPHALGDYALIQYSPESK